jgi:hypothetical protein
MCPAIQNKRNLGTLLGMAKVLLDNAEKSDFNQANLLCDRYQSLLKELTSIDPAANRFLPDLTIKGYGAISVDLENRLREVRMASEQMIIYLRQRLTSSFSDDLEIGERGMKEILKGLSAILEGMNLPPPSIRYIRKAILRINEGSYSETIMNCYRVSETLTEILFDFLYSPAKKMPTKHADKLKRIWNDEEKEKREHSGIRVIASLFAVILWYRNKMGAHMVMKPTRRAAVICLMSLIQALTEFKRLKIETNS